MASASLSASASAFRNKKLVVRLAQSRAKVIEHRLDRPLQVGIRRTQVSFDLPD